MAITKIGTNDSSDSLDVKIDNGDFQALQKIQDKMDFKDKEAILRFAIAAMTIAEGGTLYVEKDGKKTVINPADSLLNKQSG